MKRMTSVLTPAVVAALLIALIFSVVTLRGAVAQTPGSQPPAAQTPAPPQPVSQPPATPPPAQPVSSQPPAPADPQMPTATPSGQSGATQTTQPPVGTDTDHGTALMLLDRIATVLDNAVKGKSSTSEVVGTAGSDDARTMKVVIDRAALDEMRAELTQIRLLLKNEKK